MSVLTIDPAKIRGGRLIEGAYAEDESITSVIIPESTIARERVQNPFLEPFNEREELDLD